MIPVVWWNAYPETVDPFAMWDLATLHAIFDHSLWRPVGAHRFVDHVGLSSLEEIEGGAVVIVSGRYHNRPGDVMRLQTEINRLPWCLLIVTSDEAHEFPLEKLQHPNMRVWVQTPNPARQSHQEAFSFGVGWPPQARPLLAENEHLAMARPTDVMFAGQVTHGRRVDCVKALAGADAALDVELVETEGFTQGVDHPTYFRLMSRAKTVACPSGPQTVDSFRLWEALEAGCVPLADVRTPHRQEEGYWTMVSGEAPPFPLVWKWSEAPEVVRQVVEEWPAIGNRVFAWWQAQKRRLAYRMRDDIIRLRVAAGQSSWIGQGIPQPATLADQVSVLMPTSPIPSHPDTDIIEETIGSVRDQLGPEVEIVVMIDGVRPEQEHRREQYESYTQRLLWKLNAMPNVLPVLHEEHMHQAAMTRDALALIETPLVLFVEHDTPLIGEIPWMYCASAILDGDADVVRFHHEADVLPPHRHLMLDAETRHDLGFPARRTIQWSQRPHLASAAYYASILEAHFSAQARTMIEDVMYGVVSQAHALHGEQGWHRHRLWLYTPEGSMVRSRHLDGRGRDPKYTQEQIP